MDPITTVLILLANVLLVEVDEAPIRDIDMARDVLRRAFTGHDSPLKIQCIKFVREVTSMSLVNAKDLVEAEIFTGHPIVKDSVIRKIQANRLPERYRTV